MKEILKDLESLYMRIPSWRIGTEEMNLYNNLHNFISTQSALIKNLRAEVEGYKNGQEQVQYLLDTCMDSNAKVKKDLDRLRVFQKVLLAAVEKVCSWDWGMIYQFCETSDGLEDIHNLEEVMKKIESFKEAIEGKDE